MAFEELMSSYFCFAVLGFLDHREHWELQTDDCHKTNEEQYCFMIGSVFRSAIQGLCDEGKDFIEVKFSI